MAKQFNISSCCFIQMAELSGQCYDADAHLHVGCVSNHICRLLAGALTIFKTLVGEIYHDVNLYIYSLCFGLPQYVSFYTAYLVAVLSLIAFVLLAWAMHTFMDQILLWLPSYASSAKAFRNSIVKFTTLVIGIVYPGIAFIWCSVFHSILDSLCFVVLT